MKEDNLIQSADSDCADRLSPSPNFNERQAEIDILLLHYTGMESAEKALKWLCMEESQVSCHYFVFENGEIVQSVAENKRAWHAGIGEWKGVRDTNSRSIGIEIANPGHEYGYVDFPEVQIEAVTRLCRDICTRLSIVPQNVLAHSDIAPDRKEDPGERFPWAHLAAEGVGHWVEPSPLGDGRFFQRGEEGQPIQALQSMLKLYGYGIEITGVFDEKTEKVVTAFQRHFRPKKVDGVADTSTITTLHRLLKSLPELS